MSDATPTFDAASDHHAMPKVRPIRGFPVPAKGPDDQQVVLLGLADAKQISDKPPIVVSPAVQHVLPKMDGSRSVAQIVEEVGQGLTTEALQQLVAQLDAAGLLFGPVFDE
ncbi:MAG: hypothetical protein AAF747_11195, partial [Planctomycetota bacterium]